MFTRQTLRSLANATSYSRGQSYYKDGSLSKLRREDDTFYASVRGSRIYRVTMLLAASPTFDCSCPYDWDGICKHSVALGLAVLDGYTADELATKAPAKRAASRTASTLVADVKAAWKKRTKTERLDFLKQALAKSDDLARQFLGFGDKPAVAPAANLLDALPQRLTNALEELDFGGEFWEENSEAFYDDGDGMYNATRELISEALAPFMAELLGLAHGGQLGGALQYWAVANTAIYQIEEPADDEYGTFDDYGAEVLHQWHEELGKQGWPGVLLKAVLPLAELKAALKWLGGYLTKPPAQWPDFEQSWLPLLQALSADPMAAPLLADYLAKTNLSAETWARLALQAARAAADDKAWAVAAEILLPTDAAVAEELLNFYANRGERAKLLAATTKAYAAWPGRFDNFVLSTFTPAQAPALYLPALRRRTLAQHSTKDFALLRPLLKATELKALVQEVVGAAKTRAGGVAFAATLLAQEVKPPALRDFVLGLEWTLVQPAKDLQTAMQLLAAADPAPLMLELETRTRAYLNGRANAQRGAALYQLVAGWLAAARAAAPQLNEPVLRLALELREEFLKLSSLRDALKQHGLLLAEQPANQVPVPTAAARRGRKPNPKK